MYVLCYLHPEQTSYLTSAPQITLESATFMQKKAANRCRASGKYLPNALPMASVSCGQGKVGLNGAQTACQLPSVLIITLSDVIGL